MENISDVQSAEMKSKEEEKPKYKLEERTVNINGVDQKVMVKVYPPQKIHREDTITPKTLNGGQVKDKENMFDSASTTLNVLLKAPSYGGTKEYRD